jgi:hypothetical protein
MSGRHRGSHVLRDTPAPGKARSRDSQGQALVEFCLVFLIFLTLFFGIVEFGMAFHAKNAVSFASRDAAVIASESGGSSLTADALILNTIDKDITAPVQRSLIDHVDIFWADDYGQVKGGAIERYTPGGALFPGWGGWTRVLNGYPASDRCAYPKGKGCAAGHTDVDRLGVTIVYRHRWVTPMPNLVGLGGTGFVFTQTNLAIMEPIPAGY